MIRSFRCVFALTVVLTMVHPATGRALAGPHIRSEEIELLNAVAEGTNLSATMKQVVDRVNALDVIIYLGFSQSASPQVSAHISLLASSQGTRYLRVTIDRRAAGYARIALLGHELHHAIEIAESVLVTDDVSLAALYDRIGFRTSGGTRDCFDTVGAILAGRTIDKELRVSNRFATR